MADVFASVRDILPEHSLPLSSIRIVRFLDADGDECVNFKHDGEATRTTTVGMLEVAKATYMETGA